MPRQNERDRQQAERQQADQAERAAHAADQRQAERLEEQVDRQEAEQGLQICRTSGKGIRFEIVKGRIFA